MVKFGGMIISIRISGMKNITFHLGLILGLTIFIRRIKKKQFQVFTKQLRTNKHYGKENIDL